jgi:cobaltochelatase CobT
MANSTDTLEIFKDATSATVRALSGKKNIDVVFTAAENADKKLHLTQANRARLPVPDIRLSERDRSLTRGAADLEGLRLRHHEASQHKKISPHDPHARAVFDALEMARIQAIGAQEMQGVHKNLSVVQDEKAQKLGYHNLRDRLNDTLADALQMYMLQKWNCLDVDKAGQALIDTWKDTFDEKINSDTLKSLRQKLYLQTDFALGSMRVMEDLGLIFPPSDTSDKPEQEEQDQKNEQDKNQNSQNQEQNKQQQEPQKDQSLSSGENPPDPHSSEETETQSGAEDFDPRKSAEYHSDDESEIAAEQKAKSAAQEGLKTSYHIYTTQFDEIIKAEDLADADELMRLRAYLDKQMVSLQALVGKLANRLQRKLLARQQRTWQFDLEEGTLDSARLARIVANPTIPLSFKQEKETDFKDTVVTILLDNSGSMRGRPITIAAMCADILARTLERCGVKVEILGFTTRAWKGGRSRDIWVQNNRPSNPGRLNDLRHIIYKSADTPWRRSKRNLGLMLKEGLLKENIDGEALAWAYNRLAPRPEDRKILMVISDGAPVDDSTLSVNHASILETDLRHVINWIEMIDKVDLTAIGIGHDVTRYYKRAITISDVDELGETLISRLSELFDKKK